MKTLLPCKTCVAGGRSSDYLPGIDRPVAASGPGAGAIRLAHWGSPNFPSE